jgi:uncharacterized membrane protein YbhN (UPF0104 family)
MKTPPATDSSVRLLGRNSARRLVWDVVVPVALMAGLALFVWARRDALSSLWDVSDLGLVLVFSLVLVAHFLNSAEFWLFYRALGTRIGLSENWMLFGAGQLMNHLPGKLGTVYRLSYMRTVHHTSYTSSTAVHGANIAVTLAGASVTGLVGLLGMSANTQQGVPFLMFASFGAAALIAAASAVVPLPQPRKGHRLNAIWTEFSIGLGQIRARPQLAAYAVLMQLIKYLFTAWRLQLAYGLIGVVAPLWLFLVLAAAAAIAGFISLTPAELGFREALITSAAAGMGVPPVIGLLGATVDRAAIFVVAVVLGGVGLLTTYPRLKAAMGTPT